MIEHLTRTSALSPRILRELICVSAEIKKARSKLEQASLYFLLIVLRFNSPT
ncbi:MAG: hypothetical protein ACI8YQ_005069 [Polaribacter sp.]|jgi:hypothetical protein